MAKAQPTPRQVHRGNDLGLAVVNEGSHYAGRVRKYRDLTPQQYRGYIARLVEEQAGKLGAQFGEKHTRVEKAVAVEYVLDHMRSHMAEL